MSLSVLAVVVLVVIALAIAVFLVLGRGEPQKTLPHEREKPIELKPKEKEKAPTKSGERERAQPPTPAKPAAAGKSIPPPSPVPAARQAEPSVIVAPGAEEAEPPHDTTEPVSPVDIVSERPVARAANAEELQAMRRGLASTRSGFVARLASLFGGKKEIDPGLIDEIEEVLVTADLGPKTTTRILDRLRDRMSRKELANADRVWDAIRDEARSILDTPTRKPLALDKRPAVVLVVGVNGVGKTTTIGKLASRYAQSGKKVVLAAGDTFRAAAVLQLEVWGRRTGCPVVKGKDSADPGSVIFEAIKKAREDNADIVIADTAGRLHTKAPLMEELRKVGRTVEKALERPADEVLLVLDSTNGQNALSQAQLFREALPVSGFVLTKLDGTAKGGVILGIVDEHKLPVRYVGIGERVEDLREFDAESFLEALFTRDEEENAA